MYMYTCIHVHMYMYVYYVGGVYYNTCVIVACTCIIALLISVSLK